MSVLYVCNHCDQHLHGVEDAQGLVPAHLHFDAPCPTSGLPLITSAHAVYPEGINYEVSEVEYEGVMFEDEKGEMHRVVRSVTTFYKSLPGNQKRTPGRR